MQKWRLERSNEGNAFDIRCGSWGMRDCATGCTAAVRRGEDGGVVIRAEGPFAVCISSRWGVNAAWLGHKSAPKRRCNADAALAPFRLG